LPHHRRNGEPCLLQLAISTVRPAAGEPVRNHVVTVVDITHTRRQLEQLQRQAHFDELTRLPNRVRLAQMLQGAMQTSRREGSLLTVCYLDLDHFKPVNDRFGHDAGDRLLVELANRMRRSLRSWAGGDDVVARIGGDEFVLLLRTATLEESRHAVERVLNQVCQPYGLGVGAGPVLVTATIGATVFPLDGADAETLLRHADHAMYGAKQAGRNGYLFFDAEHDRRAEARFVALGRVQEALDANEFRLFFQPKVDMRSAKVLGVEALLRWKHPEQGVVSPAQFLPLIENTGLSISVGNWVLQQGIDQLARWLRMGLDITVSINVSARHLQEPLFAQHLAGLLSRHQAPVAHRLILEVLETAAVADVDYTCALMEECRALGVRFALDDFGTGYSTFTYLKRLPIDMLKIDRSFVLNMLDDRQDLAIVEGVIGLSHTFGCSVVAEGVETRAQADRLIAIGCPTGQGNGIAAAMPADQVADWVRDYDGMPESNELLTPA
jgi:diguanylate cyclase (GGDEF)-like protein